MVTSEGYETCHRVLRRFPYRFIARAIKYLIVLHAPICHVICARSRGCPICTFYTDIQFELFVIGYPRDSRDLSSQSLKTFQNLGKALQTFLFETNSQKKFLLSKL